MYDINPPKRAFPRRLGICLAVVGLVISLGLMSLPQRVAAEAPDQSTGSAQPHPRPTWHGGRTGVYPPGPPVGYGTPAPPYPYRHQTVSCGGNTAAGIAIGAGVGGLIGSQIGDRPGDAGTTVFGILVGAVVGGALGQSADRANGC